MKKPFTYVMLGAALCTMSFFAVSCGGGEHKTDENKKDTVAVDTTPAPLPTNYLGYEVVETEFPATVFVMKKDSIEQSKVGDFFGMHLPAIDAALTKGKIEKAGAPAGLYWSWDDSTKVPPMTVMAAAIPVKTEKEIKIKGYDRLDVAGGKSLLIEYLGNYDKVGMAHGAMDMYMKDRNMETSLVIEEYVTDPMMEKDTSKWVTKIYYILK